jgi:cell division protein FtsZ
MYEIDEAAKAITEAADPAANIIFGAMVDDSMSGDIKITVIATGFDQGAPHKNKEKENEIGKPVLGLGGLPPLAPMEDELDDEIEQPVTPGGMGIGSEEPKQDDMEVPAFIRRKLK